MSRGRYIAYSILIAIPVLAVLVLLALVNVLYLLLGIVLLLVCLYVLKRKKPGLFSWMHHRGPEEVFPTDQTPREKEKRIAKVYVILSEQDIHDDHRITVTKTQFYIGRDEGNDYVLHDMHIGRRHLRIEYNPDEGICYAVDLGSVNGSYLNSQKMVAGERYQLTQGDRIMLDDRPFEVEYAHY